MGTTTDLVQADGFPIGINASYTSIAIVNNVPFIAFCDTGQVFVKRLSAGNWISEALPSISSATSYCSHTCLVSLHKMLFLAYIDNHRIRLLRRNISGIWANVTISPNITDADYLTVTIDNDPGFDHLYLSWIDKDSTIHVLKLPPAVANSINVTGSVLPTLPDEATNLSISAIKGSLYIAFSLFSLARLSDKGSPAGRTNVRLWDGSGSWKNFGYWQIPEEGFASGTAFRSDWPTSYNCIEAGFSQVYLAYKQTFPTGQLALFSTTGESPNWQDSSLQHDPLMIGAGAEFIASAIDRNSTTYIAHSTNDCNNSLHIYQLSQGVISHRFEPSINSPTARYLSLSCDDNNINSLYIAYVDTSGFIRALKFDWE